MACRRVRSIVEDGDGVLWVGFGSGVHGSRRPRCCAVATPGYRITIATFNRRMRRRRPDDRGQPRGAGPRGRLWFAAAPA
jgi:hypothetical protein